MTLKCPEGMVLINAGGAIHPDEPAFCISKTEVAQEADNAFWAKQLKSIYELLITLVNGATQRVTDAQEAPLRTEAAKQIQDGKASGIKIQPVVVNDKPQPAGKLAGPKKPAVYRSWDDAVEFCQGMYKSGNLPTIRQWEKACGSGEYCTASGTLNHPEAVYDADGPADVGSKVANSNGVYDMTGNVWEWLRDSTADGAYRYFTGGSWNNYGSYGLGAASRGGGRPGSRGSNFGFRCVASPEDSSKVM